VRRRAALLGFGAVAVAEKSRAQAPMPVVGILHSGAAEQNTWRLSQFYKGLADVGFVPGKNVSIEPRWADGHNDRLPAMAADLIRQKVAVIATPLSTPAAVAAKAATSTIPIVFVVGFDPVELGLVASLGRPGGNATGATAMNADVTTKKVEMAHDLVPEAKRYYALANPTSPLAKPFIASLQSAAPKMGLDIEVLNVSNDEELQSAFARIPKGGGSVVITSPDSFLYTRREQIGAFLAQYRLPSLCDVREYVEAGALASYGADASGILKLAGNYTGRILKGEKPANLPVAQSSKFEFVLSLKAAKAIGMTIPPSLISLADDVIE
jgi:putative ABC transport system substrate-binding protein